MEFQESVLIGAEETRSTNQLNFALSHMHERLPGNKYSILIKNDDKTIEIFRCFDEGRYTLPGTPRNIRVTPLSSNSAKATWDPPVKNPDTVELYRILYREQGTRLVL